MFLAAYPLFWLALVYSFAIRARFALGHWPYIHNPNPKDLGFTFHLQLIWPCFKAIPLVAMVTVILAVIGRRACVYPRIWPALTFLVFSIVLVVAIAIIDPRHLIQWLTD